MQAKTKILNRSTREGGREGEGETLRGCVLAAAPASSWTVSESPCMACVGPVIAGRSPTSPSLSLPASPSQSSAYQTPPWAGTASTQSTFFFHLAPLFSFFLFALSSLPRLSLLRTRRPPLLPFPPSLLPSSTAFSPLPPSPITSCLPTPFRSKLHRYLPPPIDSVTYLRAAPFVVHLTINSGNISSTIHSLLFLLVVVMARIGWCFIHRQRAAEWGVGDEQNDLWQNELTK